MTTVFARWAVVCCLAQALPASTVDVFYNRADWQAAMSLQGSNPLTTIGFSGSEWTSSLLNQPQSTELVSQSTAGVTAVSGYSVPGMADNSTLGHVANGMWTDNLSKYGSTTFQFAEPIYGFGGDFDITGGSGLFISAAGEVGYADFDGFIGIISAQPMDSLLISWSDNGNCPSCFGASYTLNDFQVATQPTPEPDFGVLLFGAVLAAVALRVRSHFLGARIRR